MQPVVASPAYPVLHEQVGIDAFDGDIEHVALPPQGDGLHGPGAKERSLRDLSSTNIHPRMVQPDVASPVYPALHEQFLDVEGAGRSVHVALPPQGCVRQVFVSEK